MTLDEAFAVLRRENSGLRGFTHHGDHLCTVEPRHQAAVCPLARRGLSYTAPELAPCRNEGDLVHLMTVKLGCWGEPEGEAAERVAPGDQGG